MSILDHPLITQRYFFPRPDRIEKAVLIPISCGFLRCFHLLRSKMYPTLIFFHGNGECVADYIPGFIQTFSGLAINLLFVEYRGYGGSDGSPQLHAMLEDVHAVHRFLRVCPEDIFVFGRSVGSIYAIEYASQYPVRGLVLESAIASPLERILIRIHPKELGVELKDLQEEAHIHLDHRQKMHAHTGPTLIMHAQNDFLVDLSHAERLASWANDPILCIFPFGDHNSIYWANKEAYRHKLHQFLTLHHVQKLVNPNTQPHDDS